MKKYKNFCFVIIFILSLIISSLASDLIRIRFRKGTFGKTVTGYLSNYRTKKNYVLWAREGQTLKVEQLREDTSGKIISLLIRSPSGEDLSDHDASCNNRKEVELPETGDYRIGVFECRKADQWKGRFRLEVSVR